MTAYLVNDGCGWVPLEPNVTALGFDGLHETVTVRCPACTRLQTYPCTPAVHLAVYRHRDIVAALDGATAAKAEAHLRKETRR